MDPAEENHIAKQREGSAAGLIAGSLLLVFLALIVYFLAKSVPLLENMGDAAQTNSAPDSYLKSDSQH
jgi:hypothetical protein